MLVIFASYSDYYPDAQIYFENFETADQDGNNYLYYGSSHWAESLRFHYSAFPGICADDFVCTFKNIVDISLYPTWVMVIYIPLTLLYVCKFSILMYTGWLIKKPFWTFLKINCHNSFRTFPNIQAQLNMNT